MNGKNISVWRGDSDPPTIHHIWIKQNSIYLYDEGNWNLLSQEDIRYNELMTEISQKVDISQLQQINEKLDIIIDRLSVQESLQEEDEWEEI